MRWKPIEDRDLSKVIEYPLCAMFLVVLSPLVLMLWLDACKRKFIGPRSEWSCWFAWHPVRSDRGFGSTVWLEWVHRRVWYHEVEHLTAEEMKAHP